MKVSAYNQFEGTVRVGPIGAVNAKVHVSLKDEGTLAASITMESVETLVIKTGMEEPILRRKSP